LLDGDRLGSYNALAGLYGPLDLQNAATIRSTLESWAPRTETLKTALGTAATDNMARFYRDRLEALGNNDLGGTVAIIGQPLSVMANLNNVGPMGSYEPGVAGAAQVNNVSTGKVPEDVSVFFAGGYLNGNSAPMATAIPAGGRDTFENLVWAKREINSLKANRLPHEAGLRLLRRPKAPAILPAAASIREPKHPDWRHFILSPA
jgi:hypothetical protein